MKLVKDTDNNEISNKVSDKEAEEAFKTILSWMGEDLNREGLLETPKRVMKAYKEYFAGYKIDPSKILDKTFGDVDGYDDIVIQKNISIQSHCEHHMAPIIGKAHVAYIPKERVVKAFKEYFKGYKEDPNQILDKTFGDVEGYDDMVVQKNISVQSHCEHHMAPIIGKAHVAYIPKDRVVGLSKLARVVEVFSKRLQTQERLTMQIANTLMESLDAKGVAVTIDSTHQCMTMRGIKKEQATTVTNYYLGQFKDDLSYQNRYLRFISIPKD